MCEVYLQNCKKYSKLHPIMKLGWNSRNDRLEFHLKGSTKIVVYMNNLSDLVGQLYTVCSQTENGDEINDYLYTWGVICMLV